MTLASAAQNSAVEQVILPPVRDLGDGFKVRRALPSAQRRMVGPFIFLDHFGPTVFRTGEGQNVRPHPHIGLSTLTYLLEGEIVQPKCKHRPIRRRGTLSSRPDRQAQSRQTTRALARIPNPEGYNNALGRN